MRAIRLRWTWWMLAGLCGCAGHEAHPPAAESADSTVLVPQRQAPVLPDSLTSDSLMARDTAHMLP
jgi:hypothetical protein